MARTNSKRYFASILFVLLAGVLLPNAKAEQLIFAPSLSIIETTLPTDPQKKTAALRTKLKSQTGSSLASVFLLLANQSFNGKEYRAALDYSNQGIELLQLSDAPFELANAYYIRAIVSSVGLRQYPSAVTQFEQVLSIAPNNAPPPLALLHAKAYQKLGSLLMFLKKPEQAKRYIIKAISTAQTAGAEKIEIDARLDFSKYYLASQQIGQAEELLMETYKLAHNNNSIYLPKVLIQVSRFYRKAQNYELAIKYGEDAIKSIKVSQNQIQLAWAHNNLAIAYDESGNDNMAIVQFLNALNNAKEQKSLFVALATHNIGSIYLKQKDFIKAQEYLSRANEMFRAVDHPYNLMHSNFNLGKNQIELTNYDQAINYLEQALQTAVERKEIKLKNDIRELLVLAYTQVKNFDLANKHSQALTDGLHQQISDLEKQQSQQKQAKSDSPAPDSLQKTIIANEVRVANLNQQLKDSRKQLAFTSTALAIMVIVFLLTLIVSWRYIRGTSKKVTRSLTNSNQRLPSLNLVESLVSTFSLHYREKDFLLAINLPLIPSLNQYFNPEQAHQLHQQWLTGLSEKLSGKVFSLNDSTIICALSNEVGTTENFFESVINDVITCAPSQCQHLTLTKFPVQIGAASLLPFFQSPNDNEANNTLNLALAMLAGVQSSVPAPTYSHWILAKAKENSQSSIFNFSSRSEWIYSIKNNLITLESNGHSAVDWDRITFKSKPE